MAERSASTQTVILAVGSCATVGKPYVPVRGQRVGFGPIVGVAELVGVQSQRFQLDCCWTDCPSSRLSTMRCRLRLRTLPSTCGAHFVDAKTCRCSVQFVSTFLTSYRGQSEVNHTCDVLAIGRAEGLPPLLGPANASTSSSNGSASKVQTQLLLERRTPIGARSVRFPKACGLLRGGRCATSAELRISQIGRNGENGPEPCSVAGARTLPHRPTASAAAAGSSRSIDHDPAAVTGCRPSIPATGITCRGWTRVAA